MKRDTIPPMSPKTRQACNALSDYSPEVHEQGEPSRATEDSITHLLRTDHHTWSESSLLSSEGSVSTFMTRQTSFSMEIKNPLADRFTDSNTEL